MNENWVKLCSFEENYQALLLKNALEDEGIKCFVMNKKDSAYISLGDVEVYVMREDFLTANYILKNTTI